MEQSNSITFQGLLDLQMPSSETQRVMEESVRVSERQRQIRIWPNRLAEYPLTPEEAFPVRTFDTYWSNEWSNEPFTSLEEMREHREQQEVRYPQLRPMSEDRLNSYLEEWLQTRREDNAIRIRDRSLLEEMVKYNGQYDRTMSAIATILQKETNKASPYLDFDNY